MVNKIYATFNFSTKLWEINHEQLCTGGGTISILFSQEIEVDGRLDYGFDFYVDNQLVESENYPKFKFKDAVISSTYETSAPIAFYKNKTHRIRVWTTADDERVETELTINNIIDRQPHPSWTYVDDQWVPPVPQPQEKAIWGWNEETQSWINLDHQYAIGSAGSATEGQEFGLKK